MHSQGSKDAIPESHPSGHRLRGLAIAAPCLAVLAIAVWLTPACDGEGTHQQLGLPQCSSLSHYGWPCPTCGMTTAFAAMAHGKFRAAVQAQAFGAVLFVMTGLFAGVGMAELISGRDMVRKLRPGLWWLWLILAGTLIGWGIKAALGWSGGLYPLH